MFRVQRSGGLRVLLICMPWAPLDMPSLALSTLKPIANGLDIVERVDVRYINIEWIDHLLAHSQGEINASSYEEIVNGYFLATGEWIFSSALYGENVPEETTFHRVASRAGADLTHASAMFGLAPDYLAALADEITTAGYDVVGFTSTFDQNMPSLALAALLKQRDAGLVTVFGGANCDAVQGAALHRNFDFVDYVVRGEGEHVFPQLLRVLAGDPSRRAADLSRISGLCWRDDSGRISVNDAVGGVVSIGSIPAPDFDDYFTTFRAAAIARQVEPKIQIEGGRGCWWGEKHHCTFCGLNGSLMQFRAKSPERVLSEIKAAVERHRILNVVFADNILDMAYLRSLMPAVEELGWDLSLFFEIKSNLAYHQLQTLAEAGVTQIQPGIESLSSRVLRLMRKGVAGWQNIRLLRDCRSLTLYPGWNLLYGFPGETIDDYTDLIEQASALTHLRPPEAAYRIVLTRFSPYFTDPDLGLRNLGPSGMLSSVYRLPPEELADFVYVFESEQAGIRDAEVDRVDKAVARWQQEHGGSRLVGIDGADHIDLVDERPAFPHRIIRLADRHEVGAYRALLKGSTKAALVRKLRRDGLDFNQQDAADLLGSWKDDGLVYQDGDRYVALATGMAYR